MIKINLPLDQSCLKTLNLRPPLLIPSWPNRSRYDGMPFPLFCSDIMCSVDKFDSPCHAWVLSIFGLTIIGFENVMVSYIFYLWDMNDISVWFSYLLYDMMGWSVDCVSCSFYIETDLNALCLMINSRIDIGCYNVDCILMIDMVIWIG